MYIAYGAAKTNLFCELSIQDRRACHDGVSSRPSRSMLSSAVPFARARCTKRTFIPRPSRGHPEAIPRPSRGYPEAIHNQAVRRATRCRRACSSCACFWKFEMCICFGTAAQPRVGITLQAISGCSRRLFASACRTSTDNKAIL